MAAQLKDPENPDRNKQRRTATLLTCIGSDALDVIDSMEFESEDQRKEDVIGKMENYCIEKCNETYERYVFNRRDQESYESVDGYVTALRKLAKTCNYGTLADSLIRDRIVVGIKTIQLENNYYKQENSPWVNVLTSVDLQRPRHGN